MTKVTLMSSNMTPLKVCGLLHPMDVNGNIGSRSDVALAEVGRFERSRSTQDEWGRCGIVRERKYESDNRQELRQLTHTGKPVDYSPCDEFVEKAHRCARHKVREQNPTPGTLMRFRWIPSVCKQSIEMERGAYLRQPTNYDKLCLIWRY